MRAVFELKTLDRDRLSS